MNKNLLFVCAITLLSFSSQSQISKGSVSIGGNIGFGSGEQKNLQTGQKEKTSFAVITPAVGIAVKENVIAGITFSYANSKNTNVFANFITDNEAIGGGIFSRRYFMVANKFYFFGEAGANYMKSTTKNTYNPTSIFEYDTKTAQLYLTPGLSYNILKSLHLEMSLASLVQLAYQKDKEIQKSGTNVVSSEIKGFSLRSGTGTASGLNIGVRFIIPKKHIVL